MKAFPMRAGGFIARVDSVMRKKQRCFESKSLRGNGIVLKNRR
jgi:hypothetical protein